MALIQLINIIRSVYSVLNRDTSHGTVKVLTGASFVIGNVKAKATRRKAVQTRPSARLFGKLQSARYSKELQLTNHLNHCHTAQQLLCQAIAEWRTDITFMNLILYPLPAGNCSWITDGSIGGDMATAKVNGVFF